MKKNTNLKTFLCACGSSYELLTYSEIPGQELENIINVQICLNCHSLTTGEKKIVDELGRVKKFTDRYKKQSEN